MPSKRTVTAIAIFAIIFASASLAATPGFQFFRGLSLDVATALNWRLFGNRHESSASPTVVVAFDEETYQTPPFKGTPTVTWTGEMARVLTAVLDGGARLIGFDVIFPTTIEESEIAFGDETVGARMRGFDRDFLRALATGASAGKIVLGEVQLGDNLILPAAGQRAAVSQQRNIRSLSVYSDPDEVVRRVPLMLSGNGRAVPSMPLELASRALGAKAEITVAGVDLGGYAIPSFIPNTMTLNFDGGSNDIPTYSLADLRACAAEKDDADFFRRNFAGKVVLLGSTLDLEDLKMTSKRFATASQPQTTARCVSNAVSAPPQARRSIDGVFVQATAINNLLRREAIFELGDGARWLLALAAAAVETLAAFTLTPIAVAFSFLLLCLVTVAATAIAFHNLIALPVVEVAIAGFAAIVATTVFRLFVTDKDKRLLRRNFEFYLAPAVIEKMASSNRPPALGGEQRDVSILFSDLVRFSTLSETMSPPDLVALVNRYLSEMTDIIEANGGLIDKYIGDAIVAVFGAPLDDRHHAESAVRAALACCKRLASLNAEGKAANVPALAHRIGVNSGPAIVGNIGSRRRFNYTVIGDSVNLASRLEGANRYFGTSIIASERTFALARASFAWRELDVVRVKGRNEAVRVYEPLALAGQETPDQVARAKSYREGLALWRARDFASAASAFARIAETDKSAAMFMNRAMVFELEPPREDWEPITGLE
jgi:adenylate cyclase